MIVHKYNGFILKNNIKVVKSVNLRTVTFYVYALQSNMALHVTGKVNLWHQLGDQ